MPGSKAPSAERVRRAAVLTHGDPERIGGGIARVEAIAAAADVELLVPSDEVAKHGLPSPADDTASADVAVVLGGDGTMLRALRRFLGTGVAVIGVNFGTVGFLTSIRAEHLERGLERVFAGEYRVNELRTLDVEVEGLREVAVNDVVVRSGVLGRMVELAWTLGGEDLGRVPCDGIVCATPAGSTAYNLSNGGPVLVWGLDAMAVSFLAPHSLHVRPLVVPAGLDLELRNCTRDVPASVLVDGHSVQDLSGGPAAVVRIGAETSLLATLPEATFFRRYGETFTGA